MGKAAMIGFFVYLIFGLYLINSSFNFITMPAFIQSIESWLILISGVLVIIGGINYLRTSRRRYY
jgi:predicted membrane channel-forming protein YqfA (hemolysin III family)